MVFRSRQWCFGGAASTNSLGGCVLRRLPRSAWFQTLVVVLLLVVRVLPASAQISASLSGVITDQTGAALPGVSVTVRNLDTGATRTLTSDDAGRYHAFDLPLGRFEIRATKQGLADETRTGITLVVGQDATVDITMQLSTVSQRVDVDADAPLVSTTTADVSGLVGERQVRDLPLNGRSYDLLMLLNPGVVNFTWEKTGGTGVSNSSTANNFSVSGNRPEQNLFLLNGVEYTGAAENNMTPGGPSGQLLGVDAVREFNVLRDSYGAEYGKHPGAQVVIVTQSGSNEWHGSAYGFLRNNDLDARNYFDVHSAPLFQRNQFGASMGGPISKDNTFVFANYEGFRQNLHQTSLTFVPANDARKGTTPFAALGSGCPTPQQAQCATVVNELMDLWPVANGPELLLPNGTKSGIATLTSSPLQEIREDFGTTRVDHIFSERDTFSANYTVDDGANVNATVFDPYSTDITNLREQVLSLDETHLFSPNFLNTARFGYSRAGYFFTGEPTPGSPAAGVTSFVGDLPVGAVVVGGSTASNPATQLGLAGSNNGSNLRVFRNLFTYEEQITLTRGRHQWSAGLWFQQFQSNETLALSQFGQLSFPSVGALVQGGGSGTTLTYDPAPTEMNWRSLYGAWYVEDVIRLTPRLTVSLGFRDEFSTGWNEAHGRAANYFFTDGVTNTDPHIGNSAFSVNNAKFLPQPRIGVAWSPFSSKTVFRAGFGMYNDLQDALGYRMDQNEPFNPTYSVANFTVSNLPEPISPIPAAAKLLPGGVQPNLKIPTLISYSLRLEQELSPNTSLTIGYIGSHGYHEITGLDANEPAPVICPAAPCPANYPTLYTASGATVAGPAVPAGTFYIRAACGPTVTTCNSALGPSWTWFSLGDSSYNALQADLNHRFSRDLSLRGVYTWSRALDDGDSLNGTLAQNAPGLVSNPYDIRADRGPATYNVTNAASINALYELPFGRDKSFANGLEGWANGFVSGWSLTSIVTLQSGFPFTPQLSYNPTKNGDTKNPVRPFINPAFTGPVIEGTPTQWFNPNAFLTEPNNSGFYGNLRRDSLIGPGVATWDFSVLKDTAIRERLRLQFRAEIFNILNHANFNTPNLILATLAPGTTTPVPNPAAGSITSTSTSARQIQFALKLLW